MDDLEKNLMTAHIPLTRFQKVFLSLAAGFTLPFTILICGTGEIFAGNAAEFDFFLSDFYWVSILIWLGFFSVLSALLLVLKGKAFDIVFGIILWLSVMCFVQGLFLNTDKSLAADDLSCSSSVLTEVVNVLIWIASGSAILVYCLKARDKNLSGGFAAILLVVLIGVQGLNLGVAFANSPAKSVKKQVLTYQGLTEVSDKDNVFVILLDRFDIYYYNLVVEKFPDFFNCLDGFTFYDNNISLFSRTYPSVTYMVTGIENDFSVESEKYFEKAYKNSVFLKDLKANNYRIKLYTDARTGYADAKYMDGIMDNISKLDSHIIRHRGKLTKRMILLSLYRYFPILLKSTIKISTPDLAGFVVDDTYHCNDADASARMKGRQLTVVPGCNNFTFLHLNGCHAPFNLDGYGNGRKKHTRPLMAVVGCFRLLYDFFDHLKQVGLYESSTIIITGDHAQSRSDTVDVQGPRVTALFVKDKDQAGSALRISHAPVSHENLFAEIVKSAGVVTEKDYGPAFFEIPENSQVKRRYCFEKSVSGGRDEIVVYEVSGDANDFKNWILTDRINVGNLYK